MTAFEEMGVLPELAKAIEEMEWNLPTDVQSEAIPLILGGGDVLMAAETGSGKTGAFCLPVLQIVWETRRDIQSGKLRPVTGKGAKMGTNDVYRFTHSNYRAGHNRFSLNMYDRGEQLAITPDGLLAQARDPAKWHGSRATKAVVRSGKYMFEATVTDDGLCRVGWSTGRASLDLGTDKWGFGYGGTGKKSNSKQFDDYGQVRWLCTAICTNSLSVVHELRHDRLLFRLGQERNLLLQERSNVRQSVYVC